jgi:formate-dependent nitrite reductase membrane component NrfD
MHLMAHTEWGFLIVVYLFLGGLGAGCLVLSAMATLAGRQQRYVSIARAGALVAPLPVMLGTGLLVFDLGRPFFFWKLFTAFAPESPMWIGTWLLTLFTFVSLAFANLHLPGRYQVWRPAESNRWRYWLAAAGIPIGIAVGIYTGVLLGAVPARPFWNTPMVAQLFLFSALSTAAALLIMVLPAEAGSYEEPRANDGGIDADRVLLLSADVVLILLELLIIAPYIIHGQLSTESARDSLALIMGGAFTLPFWVGVVGLGLLAPLAIEAWHLVPALTGRAHGPARRWMELAVAVLVLCGGFLLRWVFVYAGQRSTFG